MVLVRSPKRGPWLRPASPARASAAAAAAPPPAAAAAPPPAAAASAATAAAGELTGGAARGQAPASAEEAHTSCFLPAAAAGGGGGGASDAAVVAAAAGAAAGEAAEGREQESRGASFTSFSPRCRPRTTAQNISAPPPRKSTSCMGFFFSEGAIHSSSAACRRPSPPAACSEACPAAASEARTDAAAAESRPAAAIGRGPASAAREATPATALPFSRSAARHLARVPLQAAAASSAAGQPAAATAAAARGAAAAGGLNARRGSSLRRSSRVHAATDAFTNSRNESLQPQAAAASSNTCVPKRVRYAPRSPLRGRGVVTSFPLPRKPLTTASQIPAAAVECQSPADGSTTNAGGAAGASCSPRENVCGAKTPAAGLDPPVAAAAAAACVASAETTASRAAAGAAAAKETDTQSQQPQLQHNVQAVELLQQLPATRALHDYVQEATRSELLKRHHREREAAAAAAADDDRGSGAAVNSLASPGAAAAAATTPTYQPGSAAGPPVAKRPALAAVSAAAAAAAAAATPLATTDTAAGALRPHAASSLNPSAAGPASLAAAAAAGVNKTPAAAGGPAATSSPPPPPAVAAAAAVSPVAAAVSVRTPSALAATPAAAAAATGSTGYSSSDKLQPLMLPRTAEELLREWSPTVDNVIQRMCDVREEEKQVTQFIILEGRALRVLRHVCKALERKRVAVAAVHATAAQQEAEQQQAYTESEKYFELVQRQAEDAAGGQALLERRLKDTQQKKEKLLQLRRQLYEEMFACALLRQKKVELSKQLISLKNTLAAREARRNAVYQLLQRTTRLRLLHRVHGHVLRAAVIPEGELQTRQQLEEEEEEEDVLLPGKSGEARELLLQQHQQGREGEEELLALQQQQQLSGEGVEDGHSQQQLTTHTQQQETEWEPMGGQRRGFGETKQPRQRTLAAGDSRMQQRSAVQVQLQQRGGVGENAAARFSGLPLKISAGHHGDANMAAGEEETLGGGGTYPDGLSLCTELSTDDSCRRLIAAKRAGEPALVTVDCRSRDGESRVCRDVDALWQLIEDAIGLSPEYSAQMHKNSKETLWSE